MVKERKYLAEFGLGVYASYKTLINVEELENLEKVDYHKYHIYCILAYSKKYFKMEKTKVTSEGIKITLLEIEDYIEKEYEMPIWKIGDGIDYNKVEISSQYPYNIIHLEIKDDDYLLKHPGFLRNLDINAQQLFDICAVDFTDKCEYEILYIGQAYGKRGERTALTRLSSHSTLQKILIDCQSKYANKQIYILLLEMTPLLNMSFDGLSKKYTTSNKEDWEHTEQVLSNLPEDQQVINITEAALINYFKPLYNVNFVENFPDPKHKGYQQYFNLDYNCLTVEIDLEFDNAPIIQILTETNRFNSSFDYIRYNLFNDPNRKSMYDIFK